LSLQLRKKDIPARTRKAGKARQHCSGVGEHASGFPAGGLEMLSLIRKPNNEQRYSAHGEMPVSAHAEKQKTFFWDATAEVSEIDQGFSIRKLPLEAHYKISFGDDVPRL
jgi:hypothetical protein